ncbi:CKLF-like MARVEL transmembrane domain-containing protein 6 [Cololabis saira]|uniref:CKLF-like MARVEL transmembrane domain-containing protein 6 n=1 Tax=Cololabis saira TaxID=129043 RepID=UPI002AD44FE9|nr:CKLF-like MARVEL transmembrane domain-containing protein 6 [Cololabis saira]
MAANTVYSATTAPNPKSSWFKVPSERLDKVRFGIKIVEVLLSLAAFVLEEMVSICTSCSALYFFEFVSCTAFLFTCLLLVLLSTGLHQRVGISCWGPLDLVYTGVIAVLFLISSIVFSSDNSGSSLETVAVVFGFLATLAFFLDAGYFLKTQGWPFGRGGASPSTNGSPKTGGAEPEEQRLNAEPNGTN